MKNENKAFALFISVMLIVLAFYLVMLFWTVSHPDSEVNKICVRAGYDMAYQPLFSNDVYCEKLIKVNFNDVEKEQ